jgi:ABC-type antimicrobial peptide transport system permease subunit
METWVASSVILPAAVLVVLSLVAGAVAVAGSVLYRSMLLRKEIATRRILGARRWHITRMFLSENVLGISAGIGLGTLALAVLHRSWFLPLALSSAVLLVAAALVGGCLAGRHAAKVPFSASGLFRTSSDTRGHS